jgi:RNAse (barnase) inhibitor barstar
MSGLAAVLAGRHDTGVFTWHAHFPAHEVAHAVEHAGWSFGHVDSWTAETKAEVMEALGKALELPEHFGKNLDALADCLDEVKGDAVLLWDGWAPFARADEKGFRKALKVLRDRAADDGRGRFTVLLRGEGPELEDVDSLDGFH